MIRRWLIYIAVVLSAVVLYWAYQQWIAWLALVGVLCLPVAALVMSLPAMLKVRLSIRCPRWLRLDSRETLQLHADCPLPTPPVAGQFSIHRVITGEKYRVKPGSMLPTDHCGTWICRLESPRVYDYLGLFFLRTPKTQPRAVTVYPLPIPVSCMPELQRYLSSAWHPKPGGGYAENHELRLYRPGDSLNQIHWKLSAKTGKYIIREAMIPLNSRILLTMTLLGTPQELDRKFGRLLWLGKELLEQDLPYTVSVLTGKGVISLPVTDGQSLDGAMKTLLSQPPASPDDQFPHMTAGWRYEIGGGEDEP